MCGAGRRGRGRGARPCSPACAPADPHRAGDASRGARADARAGAAPSSGRAGGHAARSTAPGPVGRSSRAARRSTRPRPRRSHRGAPCARRTGNSETARAAAARARAAPPQTSRRPAASSCRGCGCRPNASPSDPNTLVPRRDSQSAGRAAASSARGRRRASTFPLRSGSPTRHGRATTP